ncbi:hypothetical protein IV203_034865 [Nitzschia inconspicua]|uniref:Uncharacterized protein n=1 Tax=Nitzschia inconspicua TaxID=303405 RepID=A0A9K3LCZ5_9STRA|nr:hypothetical protein IV203_034865 [Nitzschia inconspicua]
MVETAMDSIVIFQGSFWTFEKKTVNDGFTLYRHKLPRVKLTKTESCFSRKKQKSILNRPLHMSKIPETIIADAAEIDPSEFELVDDDFEGDGGDVESSRSSQPHEGGEDDREGEIKEGEQREEEDQTMLEKLKSSCKTRSPCQQASCVITTSLLVLFLLLIISTLANYDGQEVVIKVRRETATPTLLPTEAPMASSTSSPSSAPTVTLTRFPLEISSLSPSSLPTAPMETTTSEAPTTG